MRTTINTRSIRIIGTMIALIWSLGPIYWALNSSFMQPTDMTTVPPNYWPPVFTLEHYRNLLGIASTFQGTEIASVWPQFSRAVLNSILVSAGTTIVTTILASFGGYAFARIPFAGRDVIFMVIVATLAIPAYTVMIPLYRMMVAAGLVDTYVGVTLVHTTTFLPLALWLMRSTYKALPLSLDEAAALDGAGKLYTLCFIVMPLAAPGIVAAAILSFLGAWGQFIVPLVFSPTLSTKPLTVLITEFVAKNYVDYGLMNAAGILASIPPLLIVVFLNRFLVKGLSVGANK